MSYQAFKHSMEYDSEKLTLATQLLGRKLFNRLTGYIKLNIPSDKSHLFPNKHWVWDSYKSKLNAGHIVPNDILQFRCNDVSLLSSEANFDRLETNPVHRDVRGTYLIVDAKRSEVVLSGIADVEVKKA